MIAETGEIRFSPVSATHPKNAKRFSEKMRVNN
jgi:hypothetical protein